jgi:quercetin dioxygenase-like cupin family protein
MSFATLQSVPAKSPFPGITGHYAHLERLTFGEVDLVAGTVLPAHQHLHEQVTYVISGRFEFTVGAETRILEAGMCAVIPGHTPHSGRALTACRVLDVFAPVREDYR